MFTQAPSGFRVGKSDFCSDDTVFLKTSRRLHQGQIASINSTPLQRAVLLLQVRDVTHEREQIGLADDTISTNVPQGRNDVAGSNPIGFVLQFATLGSKQYIVPLVCVQSKIRRTSPFCERMRIARVQSARRVIGIFSGVKRIATQNRAQLRRT